MQPAVQRPQNNKNKEIKMKKITSLFLVLVFAGFLASIFMPFQAKAGSYDCSASINFNVSPTTITDSQSAVVSGTVTLVTPGGVICTIPGLNNVRMSQLIVSVFDQKSSQEIFYISGFNYTSGSGGQHTWTINPRSIGVKELSQSKLSSASSLSLVGIVKVSDDSNKWYQLTKSSTSNITVNTAAGNMPEFVASNYSVKLGDVIQLSLKNGKSNWSGSIFVNGSLAGEISSDSGATPLAVTLDNGFKDNFTNDVTLVLTNDSDLKNDGKISVKVGTVAGNPGDPGDTGNGGGGGMQGQSDKTLYNPISGVDNLTDLLLKIMQGFLVIIGVWSVVFIVLGGFRLVMSQGNEEAVSAAKKTITWAVIGLVIALLSFSIVAIVQNLLGIDIKG
jgi:hypothetical protein